MSLYPPKRINKDFVFERVPEGVFVNGVIEEVEHDPNHKFTGKFAKEGPAVRLKFRIEGCQYLHQTSWMSFNYGPKSGLYLKYLSFLVDGAEPDMEFDLERLKGLAVKMVWMPDPRNPQFQIVQVIQPKGPKLSTVPF